MHELPNHDAAALFLPLRPHLIRVAYRMLGSVADAEDVVQDAFLRWLAADRTTVRDPAAFLRRVVTRLCLDVLKSARRQRETYIGPWLPEPVVESDERDLDDVTPPLLMALERLSPLERAAFLLHDVFGFDFEEVARTIGRESAACRKLATRARAHIRVDCPRYPVPSERGFEIAEAFFAASRHGDTDRLRSLLAEDITVYADGGGRVSAHRLPTTGQANVLTLFASVFSADGSRLLRWAFVNGLPGFVSVERGGILQTTAIEIENHRIIAVYVMRNPDKLKHIARD